jgi:hypothetical protein
VEPAHCRQRPLRIDPIPTLHRLLHRRHHRHQGNFPITQIPIGYFLYRIKNINDSKYVISMGLFKLILNANKSNPITRNLTNALSHNA